jgi:hypothetical protein
VTAVGWLPSVLMLVLGIVLLVPLVLSALRALRRTRSAAGALSIAVAGRTMRVRAGMGELHAWRAGRRAPGDPGPDA